MAMYGPTGPRKLRGDKRIQRQPCSFPDRVGEAGREGGYRVCWNCGFRPNVDRDALGPGSGVTAVAFTDLLTGGTATASSEDGANVADNAIDGSSSTRWAASSSAPGWWQYDLGSGNDANFNYIKITPYYASSNSAVKDWELYGSADGSKWNFIDDGQLLNTSGERTIEVYNCWKHRYFRFWVLSTWAGNPSICELEALEGLYYPSVTSGCPFCGCRNYA